MLRSLVACMVLAVLLPSGTAALALSATDRITLHRAQPPLALDPSLRDPRWAEAMQTSAFIDMGTKMPTDAATRVALYYDDRAIYVGVQAEQHAPVEATQTTDDVGFGTDDFVGLLLDVTGNGGRTYLFAVTPRGTRYAFAGESTRFKPDWKAAATTTPGGWNAVLQIPYSAVRLAANGTQRWRVNVVRNIAATAQHQTMAYAPLMTYGTIPGWPDLTREWRYWPTVDGVSLADAVPPPHVRAEFFTLESAGTDRDAFTAPSGATIRRSPRLSGIDLSIPLDATTSLVGAFSPDFSNVETDQLTIAPQQFRRALNEYRPFFAQGAPYINPALQQYEFNLPQEVLFYSPAVGPFDRGLKIVGTKGITAFGALDVRGSDPVSGAPFEDVAFGVRQRRPSNTLAWWLDGVLASRTDGVDRSWEVGAFGRSLASGLVYSVMHAQESGTFVKSAGDAQKTAGWIDIQKPGLEANLGWEDTGPAYAPIAGFTNIADVRGPLGSVDLTWSPKRGGIKNGELYLYADRWLDRQGNVHASDLDAYLTLRTRTPFAFYANEQLGSLRTYEGDYYSGGLHGYRDQRLLAYKTGSVGVGYGEGTPNSLRTDLQLGPFGTFFLRQTTTTFTHAFGPASISIDYDGTREQPPLGAADGQWLRRYSIAFPLGRDGNATLAYRDVSGRGGFATPGRNLAGSLRKRFHGGNELFLNYGTPAAGSTLDRWILKYLIRVGGGL